MGDTRRFKPMGVLLPLAPPGHRTLEYLALPKGDPRAFIPAEGAGAALESLVRRRYPDDNIVRFLYEVGPWVAVVGLADVAGRTEAVSVEVHASLYGVVRRATPLAASRLRIPWATLIDDARVLYLRLVNDLASKLSLEDDPWTVSGTVGRSLRRRVPSAEKGVSAPKAGPVPRYDDTHFRLVAEIYEEAHRDGLPPTRAVALAMSATPRQAAHWVMTARGKGFLPQSLGRGRAGFVNQMDHKGDES